MASAAFDFVSQQIEEQTAFTAVEARGTVRLALKAAGLDVIYVPFKGGAERAAAIAGGHIDLDFDIVAPMKPLREAGRLKVLGVASEKRVDLYSDIPTWREQGVNVVIHSWHGVFAPKGTPDNAVARLREESKKAAASDSFKQAMKNIGDDVTYMDQPEFKKFLEADAKRVQGAVRQVGKLQS